MKKKIILGIVLAAGVLFINTAFFAKKEKTSVVVASTTSNEAIVESNSASWD
jgi:poly-D-alanine transfer protein DltD